MAQGAAHVSSGKAQGAAQHGRPLKGEASTAPRPRTQSMQLIERFRKAKSLLQGAECLLEREEEGQPGGGAAQVARVRDVGVPAQRARHILVQPQRAQQGRRHGQDACARGGGFANRLVRRHAECRCAVGLLGRRMATSTAGLCAGRPHPQLAPGTGQRVLQLQQPCRRAHTHRRAARCVPGRAGCRPP